MSDQIQLRFDDDVATLTLSAPERRNAIDLPFCEAWAEAASACAARDDLSLILIRAEGDLFSVGGDLAAFVSHGEAMDDYVAQCVRSFHAGIRTLREARPPSLLALNGTAAGGAFSLVCGADFVIAKRSAKLVSGYTKTGLTPDGGLSWLLAERVGTARAFEIMATNRPIGADEAERLGLIARVVDDAEFDAAVAQMVKTLAAMPPGVLADIKRLVLDAGRRSFDEQLDAEMAAMTRRGGMPDTLARMRAFLKR